MKRQIIALGGGGFSVEPDDPLLDSYVLAQSPQETPKVCFFPHATDEATRYAFSFFNAFSKLNCRPSSLSLFSPHTADIESFLLEQDIIYVGGGNTKSMLALWREWNLDNILKTAYTQGVILTGVSAGANCWFQQCSTDSIPGTLGPLEAIGFLPGSFTPHFNGELDRRPTLHEMLRQKRISPGYAADDCVAIHFINEKFHAAVSSRPDASAYQLTIANTNVKESKIKTPYLGNSQ